MDNATFNCEACGDTFNSERDLEQHIESVHKANGRDISQATAEATEEDEESAA